MRCAWREVASYVDVWWEPAFIAFGIFAVILAFAQSVPRPPWLKSWSAFSIMDMRRFNQWLRDAGRGWIIIVRRLLVAWFLLLLAWALISPTFCENVQCRGAKGLLPRTECLPETPSAKASRYDSIGLFCSADVATHDEA
jgi:hypothetical protein